MEVWDSVFFIGSRSCASSAKNVYICFESFRLDFRWLLTEAAALQVYAVDKSPEAVAWAQLNVQRLRQQLRVQVTDCPLNQYTCEM